MDKEKKPLMVQKRVESDLKWAVDWLEDGMRELKACAEKQLEEVSRSRESWACRFGRAEATIKIIIINLEYLVRRAEMAKEVGLKYIQEAFAKFFGTDEEGEGE